MKQSTALLLSASVCAAGALCVAFAAWFLRERLGAWQSLLYAAAFVTIWGALYPFRHGTWGTRRWMRSLLRRSTGPSDSGPDLEVLPLLPTDLAALFEERLQQVERRERELADRLAGYHQWFEFPPPLDLAKTDPTTPERIQRDRKLDKLLEEKTQLLFEKIRRNEYSTEGQFDFALVRNDAYALAGEIATLYGDDPGQPLAGVSSERVLRAAGRCCLKFLVELEKLPLDIHNYDIVDVYRYIRQAVNVYGIYRTARRYMPWFRGAYYGSWIAMGANPITLGAWWFASSLGSKGATNVATNMANRWALGFLHDLVRVVGYEMASVYDPNLRYRDPNWCFAAELTELVQFFPSSELSLRRALSLIGALQLRNEYDRIFFFRCIVEGKRAGLKRMQAADLLPEQRQEIGRRLESFLESYINDPKPKAIERWRAGVEDRLDIALTPDGPVAGLPEKEQQVDAVRSLAGFLLEIKQAEPEALQAELTHTRLVADLTDEDRARLWESLRDDPPFFFQTPAAPAGPVAEHFMSDLIALAVRVPPRYEVADEIVLSAAVRLRCDARDIQKRLNAAYVEQLNRRLPEKVPTRNVPPEVARAVLDLVATEGTLRFLYGSVFPINPVEHDTPERPAETWLVGIEDRLVALQIGEMPELIWEGGADVQCDTIKGRLRSDCRLTGGRWLNRESGSAPILLLRGLGMGRSKRHFAPLVDFCTTKQRLK